MDNHDSPLRCGVLRWVKADPTLTVFERKAFAAMVNIDISDGGIIAGCSGPFASKPAPTFDLQWTQ
ncbi:hypothetical protein ASC74_09045 [Pseudomonas sp. Root329]|nr:hypothetical protein ASC74_09045 [Pseudomonas sp. Root329]